MKVLFVSSGDKDGNPRAVVKNQGDSLISGGLNVRFFCIAGKGLKGYLRSIPGLKREIETFRPDIVHVHYSLSGFIASLAGCHLPVVSLMGSEAFSGLAERTAIRYFSSNHWGATIVKTEEMAKRLRLRDAVIQPNGVNTDIFSPREKEEAVKMLGWDPSVLNIIFVTDRERPEKNFALAQQAVGDAEIGDKNLICVQGVAPRELVQYYCAADFLLLTSSREGSPNVIKEAMACNCPIVSTNVGDVEWVLGETEGTFVSKSDNEDLTGKIVSAAHFAREYGRTKGRERIFALGLDSATVSARIISIYNSISGA